MWLPAETLDPKKYAERDLRGICAICREAHIVRYCPVCKAVTCDHCRGEYFWRGVEAVRALFGRGYHGAVWEG